MRHILLTAFLAISLFGNATTYYFSAGIGDDSRTAAQAQDPNTPWRSLQKLNAIFSTLLPGDSVLLRRGDVFWGKILVTKSGAAGSNIVIAAYGDGAKPAVNGFTTLSNFGLAYGKVWSKQINSGQPSILLVNDKQQPLGRYPNATDDNAGFLTFESHAGSSSITDNNLPAWQNWKGGELVIRKNRWVLDRSPITDQIGTTLTFTPTSQYDPVNNFGFFIQNHLQTLDKDGEWYFDNNQKKIYLYKDNSPAGSNIKVSITDTLLDITKQAFITLQDLQFSGADQTAILLTTAKFITISGCDIKYAGLNGILVNTSSDVNIENNNLKWFNNNAITTSYNCRNIRIANNTISNSGLLPGLGKSGDLSYHAIIIKGKNNLVEYNTIDSTGYIPIRFEGDSVLIQNNYITNFLSLKDDGAAIYTWNNDANAPENVARVIKNNVIINGIGAGAGTSMPAEAHAHGIYLDDNAANVEIKGNTVAYCAESGVYIHNARKTVVQDNTLFNNDRQIYFQHDNVSPNTPIKNVDLKGNILFAKTVPQSLLYFRSAKDDIAEFGNSDNNFFSSPFQQNPNIFTSYKRNYSEYNQVYDLSTWQGAFSRDLHSSIHPVQIPSYKKLTVSSTNRIGYGKFDINNSIFNVYGYWYSGNFTIDWSSGGKLDGGALQLSFDTTTNNRGYAIIDIGSVTAGKTYLLKFSALGKSNNKSMNLFLRKKVAPYSRISDYNFCKITRTRSENEFIFTATESSSSASVVFDVSDQNSVWIDNVGFYDATVERVNPDDYLQFEYNATSATRTIALNGNFVDSRNNLYSGSLTLAPFTSIVLMKSQDTAQGKADQAINFPEPGNKYIDDPAFELAASASSGLPISYKVVSGPASVVNNVVTMSGPGTVVIEASQPGDNNYSAATPVQRSFIIDRADQQLTFPTIANRLLGDSDFELDASSTAGLSVSYRIVSGPATITGNTVSLTGVGTVVVEASQPGDSYYSAASPVTQSFVVSLANATKANQTISFPTLSYKFYGNAPFELAASASSGLPVTYRVVAGPVTLTNNLATITGAGNVIIEAAQAGDGSYNPAPPVQRSFTIGKASQQLNFPFIGNHTVGDDAFDPAATSSSGLPVNYRIVSGPATVVGGLISLIGSGTVVVEASQPGDKYYAAALPVTRSFFAAGINTNKQGQSIRFDPIGDRRFVDGPVDLSVSSSSGLPVSLTIVSGPAILSGSTVSFTGLGTVVVAATQAGNDLFNAASPVVQTFEVIKTSQTISFGTLSYKTFSSPAFPLSATASSGLPVIFRVVSGPVTIAGNMVTINDVGLVTIEAYQQGDSLYARAAPVQRSFSVGKASQTLTFPAIENKTVDAAPFALNAVASSGLPVAYRILSGKASIAGNVLTITGTGTVVVEASQPGDAIYAPAFIVKNSFKVSTSTSLTTSGDSTNSSLSRVKGRNTEALTERAESSLSIYPNPLSKKGVVRVVAKEYNAMVVVVDISGRIVKRFSDAKFESGRAKFLEIEAGEWQTGVYFIRMMDGQKMLTQKFLVIKQ